jgi:repressor LexA
MSTQPTPKQRRILDFIAGSVHDRGLAPTLREIGRRFGVSVGTAQDQVLALESKGLLKRRAGLARSFQPVDDSSGLTIPVLGRVSAGTGVLAMDHIEAHYGFRDFALGTDFLLRVKGDSMEGDGILEGDLVQVRRQPTATDGEIVVAMVEDEGVVKRLRRVGTAYQLESSNPRYPPIIRAFQVVGKVVGLVRRYNR